MAHVPTATPTAIAVPAARLWRAVTKARQCRPARLRARAAARVRARAAARARVGVFRHSSRPPSLRQAPPFPAQSARGSRRIPSEALLFRAKPGRSRRRGTPSERLGEKPCHAAA
eukprot:6201432-Pleurochrysis_carterae.AAC.1